MRRFRCVNPDCEKNPGGTGYEFEAAARDARCPECDAETLPLVPVHLLVKDKAGPIKTALGGRRIACDPASTVVKGRLTAEPAAVTCPVCKTSADYERLDAAIQAVDEHEIPAGTKLSG